jgi:DNA-binding PadR family transcriptional regulator
MDPRHISVTTAVLLLLYGRRGRVAYGLAMADRLLVTPSAVYKVLGKLQREGLVVSIAEEEVPATPRRARCDYRLTPTGIEVVQELAAMAGLLAPTQFAGPTRTLTTEEQS